MVKFQDACKTRKICKNVIFWVFSKLYIGMSSYQDEFLHVKIESLMFLEEFCTKNESISFDIHGILVPQILWVFLQIICGFMAFGMDFDLKVMLVERIVLGMWKRWCQLFSVHFVNNNSKFLTLYIEIYVKILIFTEFYVWVSFLTWSTYVD